MEERTARKLQLDEGQARQDEGAHGHQGDDDADIMQDKQEERCKNTVHGGLLACQDDDVSGRFPGDCAHQSDFEHDSFDEYGDEVGPSRVDSMICDKDHETELTNRSGEQYEEEEFEHEDEDRGTATQNEETKGSSRGVSKQVIAQLAGTCIRVRFSTFANVHFSMFVCARVACSMRV